MAPGFRLFLFLTAWMTGLTAQAQSLIMTGRVFDRATQQPMSNVNIVNTFTERGLTTDSTGAFRLEVQVGHLVEFRRIGYKIERVRIEGLELPYYLIAMREGAFDLQEVEIIGNNYRLDSVEKSETYKWAIAHYKLEGMDILEHPFDALSKRNRQIWAFQKHYEYFEKEKFITFVFNEKLIKQLTGITDPDQILLYQQRYRPSYLQIKQWTEYEFYNYIKQTGKAFQNRR